MRIQIAEFIGRRCITIEQARELYDEIHPRLLSGEEIVLDFDKVQTVLSLFLNNSVGILLKDFDRVRLLTLLKFENLSDSQRMTMDHVLENAEAYHRDPSRKKAVDDTLARMLEEMDR